MLKELTCGLVGKFWFRLTFCMGGGRGGVGFPRRWELDRFKLLLLIEAVIGLNPTF